MTTSNGRSSNCGATKQKSLGGGQAWETLAISALVLERRSGAKMIAGSPSLIVRAR